MSASPRPSPSTRRPRSRRPFDLGPLAQRKTAGVIERRVRQGRQNLRHVACLELPRQVGEPHLEGDPTLRPAQRPDEGVDVGRLVRGQGRDLLVHLRPRAQRRRRAGTQGTKEHQIGHVRVSDERLPEERARSEERAEGAHAERILRQGADVGAGHGEAREERSEQTRGLLGIGGVGEGDDQTADEGGVVVARGRTERTVRRSREREQVPRQIRERRRAERLDRRSRNRHLVLCVEGRPEALECRLLGPSLTERSEARCHDCANLRKGPQHRVRPVVPERPGDALGPPPVAGDSVRLLARSELDAMLDATKKEVRVRELTLLPLGDEAAGTKSSKRVDRVRAAHARVAPTPHELQALREELDLADPPPSDLQIFIGAEPRLGPRSSQHGCHLVCDPRVDRAPPHERRERVQQTLAELDVSRDGAGPDERGALPGPTPRLVVTLGCRQGVDERPARSLRPKPQVHPPYASVLGRLIERRDEALGDTREVLVEGVRGARCSRGDDATVVRLVEEHEVDVAPCVELAATELAHADHDETTRGTVRGERPPEASLGPGHRLGEGDLAAHVGEIRELTGRHVDVVTRMREELSDGHAEFLPSRPASKAAPHARSVGEVADGARRESPKRTQISHRPRPPSERDQVFRMGIDLRSKRRVGTKDQRAELDELLSRALPRRRKRKRSRRKKARETVAGGSRLAGVDVLRSHGHFSPRA